MALTLEQEKAEEKGRESDGSKNKKTPKELTAYHWKAYQADLEIRVKTRRGFPQFNIGWIKGFHEGN